jgi:nucleoside-diphosphate-sugar epimerase
MRIFVAGASGAIGRPLIAELIRQGHAVTGMSPSETAIPPSQPRPGALSLEHGELLTKGQVLQGDISDVSGRSEETKQRTKQREHGV